MESLRRNVWKSVWLALAMLLVIAPQMVQAERVEDLPQPTAYVSDFAHVLAPETAARLNHLSAQLDQQAKTKLAVVTVNSLEGDDAADYANRLEDHWKMGDKRENRMAMVLLAVGDHKYRIEVGYGLEGILPDGKVGDIGRAMVPLLRHRDYDGAVAGAAAAVAQAIAADAKIQLDDSAPEAGQAPVRHKMPLARLILIVLVVLFFGGFGLIWLLMNMGIFGGWGGGGFGGGGWGPPGGFGGGGLGGGGGGDSFGGFGGDGGGFGGGGAGGDW